MKKEQKIRAESNPALKEEVPETLTDLNLGNMDFNVVKKILSDYIADSETAQKQEQISESGAVKDDSFLELTVLSLEEGLKKAGILFDAPLKEIKFRFLESVIKEEYGKNVKYQRYEFRKKLVVGKPKFVVSEDKLQVSIFIVFPKVNEKEEISEKYIINSLKDLSIRYGILESEIGKTVERLKENYDAIRDITIVKGKSATKGKDCRKLCSVFSDVSEINYYERHQLYLGALLKSESLKTIEDEYFSVFVVHPDELIASTTEPGKGEPGIDVYGNEIPAGKGNLLYQVGENVEAKFEDGKINYYAKIFGYLEFEDDVLSVHSPIWVSKDYIDAYYINLPSNVPETKLCDTTEISRQLKRKDVLFGIKKDVIRKLLSGQNGELNNQICIQIAEGIPAQKGEDAQVELFFDAEAKPGKLLENGRIDYREIDTIKTVKNNQLIAAKYPEKEGNDGKNIRGDIIKGIPGKDRAFNALNNVRVEPRGDTLLYYSTIEGRVVLVGENGISVNQVYNLNGNVDFNTGNIDFNGDVNIRGSINTGFKVKAEGDINVKGSVNQGVVLISSGNIHIKQGALGKDFNTVLKAKGTITAQYTQNIKIESESDVIVKDYIMNCSIKSKGKVISPDPDSITKGTGSIFGGEIIAMKGVIANSLGSDMAKMTKVITGMDFEYENTMNNLNKGISYCESETLKISKFLKLGFQDIKTVQQRIAGMPKDKQKPYLLALKKLGDLSRLKTDLSKRKEQYITDMNELSLNAKVLVNKELHQRVIIQIGEARYITEKIFPPVSLKLSKNGKTILINKV